MAHLDSGAQEENEEDDKGSIHRCGHEGNGMSDLFRPANGKGHDSERLTR